MSLKNNDVKALFAIVYLLLFGANAIAGVRLKGDEVNIEFLASEKNPLSCRTTSFLTKGLEKGDSGNPPIFREESYSSILENYRDSRERTRRSQFVLEVAQDGVQGLLNTAELLSVGGAPIIGPLSIGALKYGIGKSLEYSMDRFEESAKERARSILSQALRNPGTKEAFSAGLDEISKLPPEKAREKANELVDRLTGEVETIFENTEDKEVVRGEFNQFLTDELLSGYVDQESRIRRLESDKVVNESQIVENANQIAKIQRTFKNYNESVRTKLAELREDQLRNEAILKIVLKYSGYRVRSELKRLIRELVP